MDFENIFSWTEKSRWDDVIFTLLIGLILLLLVRRYGKSRQVPQLNLQRRYGLRLIHLIIIVVITVMIMSELNPGMNLGTVLLRGSALLVAIVGFAGQTAISDVICGFLISFHKPFEIGDRIEIEGLEPGIVEDITLRHVVVAIYDDMKIIVPNSTLNSKTVINNSFHKKDRRGIHLKYTVSYDTDVQTAMDIIRDCVAESPYTLETERNGIREDSGPVYFLKYGDSALILETTIWVTRTTSSYVATTDINLRVNQAFRENGIEIPYQYVNVVEYEGIRNEDEDGQEQDQVVAVRKSAPSKRHYRTNTLKLAPDKDNLSLAIGMAQHFARRQRLAPPATMQIQLLTEEALKIIASIVEDVKTNFWIEGSGQKYQIHLTFKAQVGSEEYKKLINLSSSGRNEAVIGIADRIWEIMVKGLDLNQQESREEKGSFEWSLRDDNLDESKISESILAGIADDVKVSVTRDKVEFLVIKKI
ncbi:MAG: mechanosensitive ion channel family protein [Lachnospiraceae bacterium]|nr:mechanosensitive ion channel family protein [Lachnospiraceae bacterium]